VQAQYEYYLNTKGGIMAVDEEQPLIRVKGADGEYDDTRDYDSK
jgi:hypothetical protein